MAAYLVLIVQSEVISGRTCSAVRVSARALDPGMKVLRRVIQRLR
jgi:hypothetical protein